MFSTDYLWKFIIMMLGAMILCSWHTNLSHTTSPLARLCDGHISPGEERREVPVQVGQVIRWHGSMDPVEPELCLLEYAPTRSRWFRNWSYASFLPSLPLMLAWTSSMRDRPSVISMINLLHFLGRSLRPHHAVLPR